MYAKHTRFQDNDKFSLSIFWATRAVYKSINGRQESGGKQ